MFSASASELSESHSAITAPAAITAQRAQISTTWPKKTSRLLSSASARRALSPAASASVW